MALICPNDGEPLVVEVVGFDKGVNVEQFRCPFCHFFKDKPTALSTLKVASETYVAPSKDRSKKG